MIKATNKQQQVLCEVYDNGPGTAHGLRLERLTLMRLVAYGYLSARCSPIVGRRVKTIYAVTPEGRNYLHKIGKRFEKVVDKVGNSG